MNYTVEFPLDRDVRTREMKVIVRQLTALVESLKVRYRTGLTDDVLKGELQRYASNNNMVPAGDPPGNKGMKLKYPKTGPPLETITLIFKVDSPLDRFNLCPCCGVDKRGKQKVHSHSIIAASMWPAIILEAVKDMGLGIDALNQVEKKIVGHMVNIGLSTAGVGADDPDSSVCPTCENLHENFSLLQRRQKALLEPVPRVDWVGMQNGATPQNSAGDLAHLERLTWAQIGRVTARLDEELINGIWKHFQKQELAQDPTAFKPVALSQEQADLKKAAIATTRLPWASPNVKYKSDAGGQFPVANATPPVAAIRQTILPPMLEFLMGNIDLFIGRVKFQAMEFSKAFPPRDYAPYKGKYEMPG